MPRLKHSIVAELPEPERLDVAQLARDCASGACDLVAVIGPTASGKTRYAVRLAEQLGGEILSADSRQVYRGMDIGTGKDLAEYGAIPYHLIDIADAGTQYNVWQFQQDFARAWADIRSRGAVPILCGGTGMYVNAVTRGYDFSEKVPLSAAREGNAGRADLPRRPFFIGTLVDRDTRNARIDARLDARLQEGMVDEIRGLLERGVPAETLISYGLEYRFVTLYLQGELSYDEMRGKLAIAIHQFAKRQMTWFRGMERSGVRIHWVEP
jgi:tRNA dimethylallyltransferase